MNRTLTLVLGLSISMFAAPAAFAQCEATCGAGEGKLVSAPAAEKKPTIVETAISAGNFKTLVAAVKAAGLAETLSSKGPFTVFAPTDEAFAKLPKATIEMLLKPENKAKLAAILTFHVVAGKVPASAVVKMTSATTVNGQRVAIKAGKKGVMVNGAKVVATDIMCGNGIIHVIDTVILPTGDNLAVTAKKAGKFGTLLAAATAAGLAPALMKDGPYTVFAPTDEAFAALPAGTVESLLKPENKAQLQAILKFHIVSGRVFSDQAAKAGKAMTLEGTSLVFAKAGKGLTVGKANIVATDVQAQNGVIHVIDKVMIPGS